MSSCVLFPVWPRSSRWDQGGRLSPSATTPASAGRDWQTHAGRPRGQGHWPHEADSQLPGVH